MKHRTPHTAAVLAVADLAAALAACMALLWLVLAPAGAAADVALLVLLAVGVRAFIGWARRTRCVDRF